MLQEAQGKAFNPAGAANASTTSADSSAAPMPTPLAAQPDAVESDELANLNVQLKNIQA